MTAQQPGHRLDFEAAPSVRLATAPLPPRLRSKAGLGVCDITKFFGGTTGGIRTYLLEKATYVEARDELRGIVLVPGARDAVVNGEGVRWYQLEGRPIPTQHPYRFLLAAGTVRRVIHHERPDIIEAGSPYLVPWITRRAARDIGAPLVWFYHTNFPRIISPRPARDSWPRRVAGRLAEAYVAKLTTVFDAAIGASDAAVRELERAGFSRVEKAPLGVDLQHFHPRRRADRAATRRAANLPDRPLALYVGRLAREKELHLLIDAWPEVEARTGAHLALIGDGPSRDYFQNRSRGRNVSWHSYVTDRERLADLLAAADIVIAPGPAETFGLAAVEAMASGTPVLSSDIGAVRELVEASGAGVVNPDPRADAMAESLIHFLGMDLAALGALGRSYAESHHGWDRTFDRLFAIYRDLIANHGR